MLNCQRVHQLLTESGLARRQFPSRSPIILHWVDTTSFEGLPEGINVKSWKPLGSPSERTRWTHGPRLQTHSSGVWTKNTVSPSDKPWEATVGTTNLTSAKKKSPQIIENNLGRTAARKKSTQLDPKIAKVWACLSEAYLLVQNLQRRPLHVVPKMEEL